MRIPDWLWSARLRACGRVWRRVRGAWAEGLFPSRARETWVEGGVIPGRRPCAYLGHGGRICGAFGAGSWRRYCSRRGCGKLGSSGSDCGSATVRTCRAVAEFGGAFRAGHFRKWCRATARKVNSIGEAAPGWRLSARLRAGERIRRRPVAVSYGCSLGRGRSYSGSAAVHSFSSMREYSPEA